MGVSKAALRVSHGSMAIRNPGNQGETGKGSIRNYDNGAQSPERSFNCLPSGA